MKNRKLLVSLLLVGSLAGCGGVESSTPESSKTETSTSSVVVSSTTSETSSSAKDSSTSSSTSKESSKTSSSTNKDSSKPSSSSSKDSSKPSSSSSKDSSSSEVSSSEVSSSSEISSSVDSSTSSDSSSSVESSSTSSELSSDSSSSDSSSEEPSETLDSYRIEFELPNWSPVAERPRLHYWGSENNAISWDVDGESNMTLKEGTTNVYYYDIAATIELNGIIIAFTQVGDANNEAALKQSIDVTTNLPTEAGTYTLNTDYTNWQETEPGRWCFVAYFGDEYIPSTPTNPEPTPTEGTHTIYYYNSEGWSNVNCYVWQDNPLVSWPGAAMSKVEDKEGWYSYSFTVTGAYNVIFNNGSAQTTDIKGLTATEIYFQGLDGITYTSFEDAEAAASIPVTHTHTLYYYNSNNWSKVNCYVWGNGNLSSWPGIEMKPVEGRNGWYSYSFTITGTYNAIFNNGTTQTKDITGLTANELYFYGTVTTPYTSFEAVEAVAK